MPIYEYLCPHCHVKVEVVQKSFDTSPPICEGTLEQPHHPTTMTREFPAHAKTPAKWEVEKGEKKDV